MSSLTWPPSTRGLDIKLVGNCCGTQGTPEEDVSQIFVLEDSEIKGPEDLPGTRIAVNSTKNLGDITVPAALENLGIEPGEIQWVPMNFSDMGAALERGDVDAIWQVEPFRTLALDAGYRPVLSNFVGAFPDTTIGYYITSGDFAEENPEVVASFQRALDKANAFANDNHDELRRIAVEEVKVDEDVAECLLFAHFEPGLDTEDIKLVASKAVEYGIISKEPNYDDIIVEPSS